MLNFMWKLLGREDNNGDYEGLDPNKTSESGLIRTFRQVSNLPVLLIESDRSGENQPYTRQFNWDMLKTLFDGDHSVLEVLKLVAMKLMIHLLWGH